MAYRQKRWFEQGDRYVMRLLFFCFILLIVVQALMHYEPCRPWLSRVDYWEGEQIHIP